MPSVMKVNNNSNHYFVKQRVGQLENKVILYMYHERLTLEEALDVMLDLIREHYDLCTAAEQRVPKTGDAQLDANVQTYIVGCRDSYGSNAISRYRLAVY